MTEKILATIICPECDREWRDKAPGPVECPNPECRVAFEVDDYGTPIQYTVAITCHRCGEKWQDDAPGAVECPTCRTSFEVDASGNEIGRLVIICPECDGEIYDNAPGFVKCSECEHEFEVDEGGNPVLKGIDEHEILEKLDPSSRALNMLRHKLLDLTTRNRLLNYKESSRSIRLIDIAPDDIYRMLVNDGLSLELSPSKETDDGENRQQSMNLSSASKQAEQLKFITGIPLQKHGARLQTPFTAQPLERRCKRLLQESRTAIEETGSNMLFIVLGFLIWYEDENSSEQYQAPLILVPVRIERARINKRTNCYSYIISYTGQDIETNLSLTEKLDHDFDLILPELDENVIPSYYFKKIERAIHARNRWSVSYDMILGMSSFAKILMFKDLDNDRWPDESKLTDHENVMQILIGKTSGEEDFEPIFGEEYIIDKDHRSRKTPLILDADSSQHSAIIDALWERKSIVVEGPPGTGKSQTISNLIAAALNEEMSVLFVAEKKAALDVVKSRLDRAGLGDFCLELHSHKTQKGQLHKDIAKRIFQKYHDAENIDRELEDLTHESEKIQHYSNIVDTTVGPNKEKIYDIFWKVERLKTEIPTMDLHFSVENTLRMSHRQIQERVSKLQEISKLREDLPDKAMHAWQGYQPQNILPGDEQEISFFILSLASEIDKLISLINKEEFKGLTIEFNLNLLRKLNLCDISILDQIPDDFNSTVGCKFIETENIQVISKLTAEINKYKKMIHDSGSFIQQAGMLSEQQVQVLANEANALYKMGYGEKTLSELCEFGVTLGKVGDDIQELENIAMLTQDYLLRSSYKFSDFLYISRICQLLEEAPKDIFLYAHPEHALELTNDLFEKVRNQCKELHGKYVAFSDLFESQLLPDNKEILSLAQELRRHKNRFLATFSRDYCKAKRCVKEFLVEEEFIKKLDLAERLREIAHLRITIEEVRCNENYNKILGPLFRGIDTNWDGLDSLITWSQKFCATINSQTLTYSLMPKVNNIRENIVEVNQKSQAILSRIINAFETIGITLNMDKELRAEIENLRNKKTAIDGHLKELVKFEMLHNMMVDSILISARAHLSATELRVGVEKNNDYRDLLGFYFNGINTDSQKYLQMAKWVNGLLAESKLPFIVVSWLVSSDTNIKKTALKETLLANQQLMQCYAMLRQRLETFGKLDTDDFFGREELSISLLRDRLETCINAIPYLVTWSEYCRSCEDADKMGLKDIVNLIEAKKVVQKDCAPLYQFIVYDSMAKELIRKYPDLASFTRANYENMIRRFVDIDKQLSKRWQERIAHNISLRKVPRGVGSGYVSEYTEQNLLLKEIQKQKRHIPIRQLVKRAGNALQALKPCFMMSPMSVAQYLEPGKIEFDMVIMDEASQIRPADAIGAIARAYQFVIVGDPNQLPPTSFFQRTGGEDYEEEEGTAVEDMDSILDICLANYQKRRLRWHYRSEHESLIAFSNNQFYDDDLIVFPAPHKDFDNNGIHYHYVDKAKYQKGRNRVEAESVTDAIVEHFRNRSHLSLGVATFNREQAELIQDTLERRQKELSWLDSKLKGIEESTEPFFIKNLENVQGDERDVIFISTTYGPDAQTGIVYQRFGPISADTGWRRLNVIVSRAKKRLELFTSMRSTDIKLTSTPSRGVQALKAYLEYAETGNLPNVVSKSGKEPGSDFEIAVSRILLNNGYKIEPQVGVAGFFIDIGVKHPEREEEFICGIECDGRSYHSAKSVRDRDRLRQEILVRKGWNIHRIWSTDWFKNREGEVQRLLNRLEEILNSEKTRVSVIHKTEPEEEIRKGRVEEDRDRMDLRELLMKYNEENILPRYPDSAKGILRSEMLDRFVMSKPLTREEFYKCIPLTLRQHTDGQQIQFLEDIFDIIDDYISV